MPPRNLRRSASVALTLFIASVVFWAAVIEPRRLEIRELRTAATAGAPPLVAVISDLHLAGVGALERRVAESLHRRRPDVIVLLGDIIDDRSDLPELETFLALLPAGETIAVLGNWEHLSGVDLKVLRRVYARHGVRLLVNECYRGFIGLDDHSVGIPDLGAAKALCPGAERVMLLQHSPGFFDMPTAEPDTFPLSVAGHTHGGQVTLFGHALWTPPGSGRFIAGEYPSAYGPLYVTRGVGTSLVPVRFGARPEIVFVSFAGPDTRG
jgi:uncharacterized protein